MLLRMLTDYAFLLAPTIFIGSDHQLFSQTGCSTVLSPYRGSDNQIIGAIGVIGPRHMNYAKIISMVDYTSETIARLLR